MVTLADALGVLFPAARPTIDYVVSDDGSGAVLVAWRLPDTQPSAEQIAAVTEADVIAARTATRRQEATTAALSASDGTAVANRAAESVGATRDNDIAETLSALCDLMGVTAEQLAKAIETRRETTPPPYGAPPPADTVGSATTRLDGVAIFYLNAAYIAGGAGDPIQ